MAMSFKPFKFVLELSRLRIPSSGFHSRRKSLISNPAIDFILDEIGENHYPPKPLDLGAQYESENQDPVELHGVRSTEPSSVLQVPNPWPEWVMLMTRLVKFGYLDEVGIDSFRSEEIDGKDFNRIRTACLNFARDRADLVRHLSVKNIQAVVAYGCPSIDRKVVNSGKRLRLHLGIDEGNVCSSCTLRGNCDRAYVKAREAEVVCTADVMRLVLTYGLDHITGLAENRRCLNKKVKESVRNLLREMAEFSTAEEELDSNTSEAIASKPHQDLSLKQGDWICPKCNFLNFARNTKCLCCDGLVQEKGRKSGRGRDNPQLKKGDWICEKCDFLNFARNTRCSECKEKPPKRQLNPGEWECDSCNYINFRRNMVCLKCDYKRPKAFYSL